MDVTATSMLKSLNPDAFLKLFVTQLQHQDPTNPMDPSQLTSQLAQLTSVQKMAELSENFQSALRMEQMGLANSLIGRQIGYRENDQTRTGTVEAVVEEKGVVGVVVNGTLVPLEEVVEIYGTVAEAS